MKLLPTLGSYIRSLRIQNQMTQSQLAERLNVTDKAVSKWERDLSYPDITLFPKLADTLGVNVNDLLNECIDEEQPSRLVQIFEMSHDIRTPLHIILGCSEMAENHFDDKDLLFRYLRNIRISGEYLLQTFDRMMQVANQAQAETGCLLSNPAKEPSSLLRNRIVSRDGDINACNFSGRRILVAEDMEINREIAAEFLKQTGSDVEFAADGQICLDMVRAKPAGYYDLILMDLMMPNMDGIEATRQIRKIPDSRKASIPIIAVSANILERDRAAALDAGMNEFAEKPFSVDKLFETIRSYLLEDQQGGRANLQDDHKAGTL